ncbi:hypothetical protein N7520_001515 [Penicillium odoratum]|uniref:uncharacterized protein n=1 Tax=Penicillium odoratum TaxID=1167516 RepID=UPI0025477B0B|nr:uncharacterized protein N7520_001515 [Penicillium odoratum]KAJ5778269.1 hypothetical protein N7520_001515 [Penicillium odoratum]
MKEDNMQKNPWLQPLRSRKLIDSLVGQARLVGLDDELIGTFRIDKKDPGITWNLSFFHDYEYPFIELEAQIRNAKEDGQFNSHWPSQEASFKIYRDNIKGFEAKKVIMDNSSDKYENRVKKDGSMNKAEFSVFQKFQRLRGPIGCVQRSPGTGKTYTLERRVLPSLLYSKKDVDPDEIPEEPDRTKIPVAKRTHPARHLSLNDIIESHSDEFSSGKPKVVRVYLIHAEKDSYCKPDADLHSVDEAMVTNADVEQAVKTEMVYKLFMDYYTENKPSRQGTRSSDSRVTLYELSLGRQIIEFAKNDARWRPWLMQRDQLAKGDLDSQQKPDYVAYGKNILQQVLADADIVVCTLFSAGQNIIREVIRPDAIFVDEAAMTKETDFWPLYTYYTSVPLLLFGDHHQLQSMIRSKPEENQFYRKMRLSPFARFVYAGLLVEVLLEQHRMAPDISAILVCRTGDVPLPSIASKTLDPKDITILTPYEAQYRLYQRLLVQAHVQSPQLGFNHVDVRKVNSFQGQESSVVIFDVAFTDKLGFMSIPNRWNVALSRARNALYVLCDRSGIGKKGKRVYCIAELIRIVDKKKLWVKSQQELIIKGKRGAQLAKEQEEWKKIAEADAMVSAFKATTTSALEKFLFGSSRNDLH